MAVLSTLVNLLGMTLDAQASRRVFPEEELEPRAMLVVTTYASDGLVGPGIESLGPHRMADMLGKVMAPKADIAARRPRGSGRLSVGVVALETRPLPL